MNSTAFKSLMVTIAVATLGLSSPAFAEGRGNSDKGDSASSSGGGNSSNTGGGNSSSESDRDRSNLSGAQNAALRARTVAAEDSAVVAAAIVECEGAEGPETGSTYDLESRECNEPVSSTFAISLVE